ncbi:MAG: preprotein translocase subunit SecE [Saezia sp.]
MATNPQIQTVVTGTDKAKLFFAILLAAAAFGVYFVLAGNSNVSGWMRWSALLVLLVCSGGVFLWSIWGQQFLAYCKDAVKEVRKVVWPTRKEAGQMTLYVFIFVLVMATFLWLVDAFLQWGIFSLLLGWGQ